MQTWLCDLLRRRFSLAEPQVEGMLRPTGNRTGHFLVVDADQRYVVHIKADSEPSDIDTAARLAHWLSSGHVRVANYLWSSDGHAEVAVEGLHATVTHFYAGRHTNITVADAASVGSALAAVHLRLQGFPGVHEVKRRSKEIAAGLKQSRDSILNGATDAVPPRWLEAVIESARRHDAEAAFGGHAQCCHGDVTPGNVVFMEDGGAVLCDFEDSAFGFHPISFDIAMATLRFGLEGGEGSDGSTPRARAIALLASYEEEHNSIPALDIIRRAIQGLSDHFLLVLAQLASNGLVLDESEWRKAYGWPLLVDALP